MADTKISQLGTANVVNKNDLLYVVQDNTSKSVTGGTLFASIMDPTLGGNILVGGNVQSLTTAGTISIATTRTDLFGGLSANTNAIANGTVLPATIYLFTANVSASGRGLTFANGTPFTRTIYVKHANNKINLSTAQGALTYPPENWVGQTGTPPFPTGLQFVKGATYIFDVSDSTNAGNIIGLSTSIDGTNTLGTRYTPNVTINGTPGTAGANITFRPANVSIDQGGKNYLDISQGADGQLKIINLVSTSGGTFVISSNIQNNLAIELKRAGDSAFLMYSGNAWILVGSNPGLTTTFSGTSDDISEGSKLYFTNARARAAITAGDATIIYDPVLGQIKANATVLANLIGTVGFTGNTDIVSEGLINKYFTNARVYANLQLASINALADVDTVSNVPTVGQALIWNGTAWVPNVISVSATELSNIANTVVNIVAASISANVAQSANVANTVLTLGNFTTANLAEGTNLYYTNTRVYANVSPLLAYKANITDLTTSNVVEGTNLYYTNARVYSNVIGILTQYATVANLNLKANIVDLTTANVAELNNLYYTNARVYSNVIGILTNYATVANLNLKANIVDLTTSNVVEGNNLYYTNARVNAQVQSNLALKANVVDLTTANIAENNNLYYTNARVNAQVESNLALKANVVDLTTANVAESASNLYYTNNRVYANVTARLLNLDSNIVPAADELYNLGSPTRKFKDLYLSGATINLGNTTLSSQNGVFIVPAIQANIWNNLYTANVIETAGNLYFTNARVFNAITNQNVTFANTYAGNLISFGKIYANGLVIQGLDVTTSILAGNIQANTTATSELISNNITTHSITANVWNNLYTANVIESASNLYYTNARVESYVNPKLTTANVIESANNLYYTNTRVYANVTARLLNLDSNIIPAADELYNLGSPARKFKDLYLSGATISLGNTTLSSQNGVFVVPAIQANIWNNLYTANVIETAGNLYYTNARVYANVTERLANLDMNIVPALNEVYNLGSPTRKFKDLFLSGTTINLGNTKLSENAGGGLAVSSPAGNAALISDVISSNVWNNLYTANVVETNGNLYYTNARVRSTLSNGTGVYYDKVTGVVSIGQNVDTTSNVTFNNMTLTGNLNVVGNVVGVYANTLIVNDPLIQLGYNNPSDSLDLGFITHYSDGTPKHAGLFRDATDKKFKFFDNLTATTGLDVTVDTANATFRLANVVATTFEGNLIGNVTGYVSTISNFSTTYLAEGNQLYYTNARVDSQVTPKLTTANVTEVTNLYYTNARVLANISQMSINVFADVDITGITANGTLIWNGTSFIAGVSSSAQAANISQSANVSNTVLSIDNFTTSNLAEGTNLYFTNARVATALTTANLTAGNLSVTGTLTARSNIGVTLGTATQGNLISNAITMTVDTTVTNGIAQLNEILGKLVPASPPTFPGSSSIAINSLATSARMTNFIQTDNTPSSRQATPASTVTLRRTSAAFTTTSVNDVGPGTSGTVTLYLNGVAQGSRSLATGSDNGTYGNLIISDNVDYSTKVAGAAGGFWESFDASGSGSVLAGWNEVYITHSQGAPTNTAYWYYDSSNPGTVTFSQQSIYPSSNVYANSSTVPHFTSATVFTMTANVSKLSGDVYPTSNTFITGSSATGFGTPSSLNYESAGVIGVPLPLTRNLYVSSGSAQVTTSVNITSSGFGSATTAPSLTGLNSYSNGTGTFTLGANVLYKNTTVSSLTTMEEGNIFVQANVGSGSGYGARIINPGSTDNPAQSASASLFNSNTSTLLSYDATIVAASLKHDQTNYSTGYLPVGPNLSSGRSGAQYYTFKFVRTSVSKFNIQFTGTVAGMWVALPGSTIDTTAAPTNGWLDMSVAALAGIPGTGTGGNGSAGCATGGTVTLNSAGTQSKTCTFGTVSSSSSATNEIYIRVKLTSGQTVTALAILGASN